jgi:hypothetical protein
MSTETAPQIQYRQQFIEGFERRQSKLRMTTTTEAVIKGSSAVFNVVDSNNETTTTRGVNGLIQAFGNHNTQNTCTLTEQHALGKITGFNVFQSQGNQTQQLQANQMAKLNRKIDAQVITELKTGTQYAGTTASPMSLTKVAHSIAVLGNADVPIDGGLFGLITPTAYSYLLQVKEFADSDYVAAKPMEGQAREFFWAGVNWIVHTGLGSLGTDSEVCIVYHRSAIGHAMDATGMDVDSGYDGEQQYSWARASAFMGAKLLQNTGVVQIRHSGLAYAATA